MKKKATEAIDRTIKAVDAVNVEELVEGKGDILTQIIDNTSFTVGGKTYEEGDKVDLNDEEKEIFAVIQRLNRESKSIKQWLLDKCHSTTRKLIPEIRPVAHHLARTSIETREKVALLINMLHSRLGGMLPLKLDSDITGFTVRAISPNEGLNYTVSRCLDLVGVQPLNDQRELSFCIARNREDSHIDMSQNMRLKFQPITVQDFMKKSIMVDTPDADFETRLLAGVRKFLEDHPRFTKTLIMLDFYCAHLINLDIQEPGRWEKILGFAEEVKPSVIYVLEMMPGKDPKKIEVTLSCMAPDKEKDHEPFLVKKTWKFQVRVNEKRVKQTDEIEGEFHSKPEDQYEDLFIS